MTALLALALFAIVAGVLVFLYAACIVSGHCAAEEQNR